MRIPVAAFSLLVTAAPADAQMASYPYKIGVEVEVDEGVYATLLHSKQGWKVWRFEEKSGHSCSATKSAYGAAGAPIGVGSSLWSPNKPYLTIRPTKSGETTYISGREEPAPSEYWNVRGTHLGGTRVKYRKPGARFWEEVRGGAIPIGDDGQKIEFQVSSYEYPELYVGRAEDHGTIDLAGLASVRGVLAACMAKKPRDT